MLSREQSILRKPSISMFPAQFRRLLDKIVCSFVWLKIMVALEMSPLIAKRPKVRDNISNASLSPSLPSPSSPSYCKMPLEGILDNFDCLYMMRSSKLNTEYDIIVLMKQSHPIMRNWFITILEVDYSSNMRNNSWGPHLKLRGQQQIIVKWSSSNSFQYY